MNVKYKIDLDIGYGLSNVSVDDVVNKISYEEYFYSSRFEFIHKFFQRKAEKRGIDKAMKFIGKKNSRGRSSN